MTNENKNQDNKNQDNKNQNAVLAGGKAGPGDHTSDVSSRMQSVKATWDKAPEGDKKADALKHYQSAETAQKSGNDAETHRHLDAATKAMK